MLNEFQTIVTIAEKAGMLAAHHFKNLAALEIVEKGHLDLFSAADKDVESFIYGQIDQLFPDDGIFGEEGGVKASKTGRTWIIDPIDGTFNFLRASTDWAISIGLLEHDQPIFGVANAPLRNQIIFGGINCPPQLNNDLLKQLSHLDRQKAVIDVAVHPKCAASYEIPLLEEIIIRKKMAYRATGSSVISLMRCAMGLSDGYVGVGVGTWDVAGLLPILTALSAENTLNWNERKLGGDVAILVGKKGVIEYLPKVVSLCHDRKFQTLE